MKAFFDFFRHSGPGRWALALTLLLVILAVFAPWLSRYDPTAQNLPARLVGPSAAHWMGADELGRDIFARIIYGARVSMSVSVSVVLGAGIIGLALGALAGYFGGWFDRLVNTILINAFLSFPGILLAIAFAAFLGPGIGKVILTDACSAVALTYLIENDRKRLWRRPLHLKSDRDMNAGRARPRVFA